MTQKKITWLLGILLAIIFGGLLFTQYRVFYGTTPTFPEMIEEVAVEAEKEDWQQAEEKLKQVEDKWQKTEPLIAIKYADTEYSLLNVGFSTLKAGIKAQDKKEVRKATEICVKLFKNMTSISSKP